jgi:predicted RecB family nuclease
MYQFQGTCSDPNDHEREAGPGARAAREACGRCPVQAECLADAMTFDSWGIWGGTNRAERKELSRVG